MSSINFRLYGDQIYGLASKYLTEYINPDINKEEFTTNFKNGSLNLNITGIKKPINVLPILSIKDLKTEKIEINIPDDKSNFILKLYKFKIMFVINDLSNNEIEKLIIEKRQKLIEKFIKEAINKIEKKENSSFLEGLLDNLVKRALDGLVIELNDIEVYIKCNNYLFLLKIENILYNEKDGIKINNINLVYNDTKNVQNKTNVIKQFNIGILINNNKDKNKEKNILNNLDAKISDINIEVNSHVYKGVLSIVKKFQDLNYTKRYIRYKKLIDFYKPKKPNEINKNNDEKKMYYMQMWYWAIKTVIKLYKYKSNKKFNIFDLIHTTQVKFSKKYIDLEKNENNNENNNDLINYYLILPEEIVLLEATKEKVEKKLLENKQGNKLANAFKFFFGGGGDEEENKKELTEEEKESLNNIYSRESIIDFLNKKKLKDKNEANDNEGKKEENMIKQFKNFFNSISFYITLNKIDILLNYFYSNHSIYIKNINTIIDLNKANETKNYLFTVEDIGYDAKYSIFKNVIKDNEAIKFIRNNGLYEISFGFKNLEINDRFVLFVINFYFSLYYGNTNKENENRFFIKQKYKNKKNRKKFLEIINKIKINNIPTINIINTNISNTSIYIDIINLAVNKTLISFNLNLKDNKSNIILDNYEIKILKNEENTKFDLSINNKLKITSPPQISEFFFIFFWEIQKLRQYYQIIQHISNTLYINNNQKNENNKLLYGFIYNIYKKLNVDEEFLNKLDINISIKNLIMEIYERNSAKTTISLTNLTLTYNKCRSLLFKLGTLSLSSNAAPLFLYMLKLKLKTEDFKQYEVFLSKKIQKDFNIDINKDLLKENNISDKIENIYTYQKKTGKLINQLINSFKLLITEIKVYYKNGDNIFSFFLNKTIGDKKENSFIFRSESNELNYMNANNVKNIINVMEVKENLYVEFNYQNKGLKIKTKNPKIFLSGEKIKIFKESFNLTIDKKRLRGLFKKLKINAEVSNIYIIFDKFNFSVPNINFKNYDDKNTKNTIFLNVGAFLMRRNDNNSGFVLMKEKEIKLIYQYAPKTEKKLNIQTTELNIMISQDDLYQLILSISYIYFIFKKKSLDEKNKKSIINNSDNIKNIDIDCRIPIINLCLCENNNYKKISELFISSTIFLIKSFYIENINSINEYIRQIEYKVLINKILLKYIDMNNNDLVLLKSGTDKNKNINHIELFCTNNKNITININKNYIILRGDSFYSLYYYFKNSIPLNEIKSKLSNNNNNIINNNNVQNKNRRLDEIEQLKFNFDYTKVLIPSTFNAKEYLIFNIEKFITLYNSDNNKFPNGIFSVTLSSISSNISSNNITRKLFYTNKEFLSLKIYYKNKNLKLMVSLDTLVISLAYTDITTFLRVYYLNKVLIDTEKKLLVKKYNSIDNNNNNNQNDHHYLHRLKNKLKEKSISFAGDFNFESFNITLIDNSSGSFYPFAQLKLNKINLQCDPNNKIDSYFSLLLNSYNYISCVWEPTIEKVFIQFNYLEYSNNKNINRNFQIDVNKMNINISDMSISFTLNSLNNWVKKLIEEKKNYKNNEYGLMGNNLIDFKNSVNQSINLAKITNNKVINHTGIKLCIKYANNIYYCDPFNEVELEYINEWDVKVYGPKQISLSVDSNTNFFIPIEKICTRKHNINNNLYIISENILSKERQININVYSPIIFKNKSLYQLQVNIFNQHTGNANYFLDQNSCIGLPLQYYDPNTYFNFKLIDNISNKCSNNYSINEILSQNNDVNYCQNIIIDKTILLMSISRKIPNVRTILINCEYMIINCLPCSIGMKAKGNSYFIEKCSQQYIDFYHGNDSDISFEVLANNTTFSSRPKRLFQKIPKENGNFLKFKNSGNTESFRLSLLIKNKFHKKIIIIYAESILDNKSGVSFYINSKNLFFQITENLYLISSKINVKESSFSLSNDLYNYRAKNITLGDIIHASPSYILDIKSSKINNNYNNYNSYQIRLLIDNSISYVTPKNTTSNKYNIISMVYHIYTSYRITNLLSTKNFRIASQENPGEYIDVPPMNQINFDFFHKGVNTPLMFSINTLINNNYDNNYGKFTSSFVLNQIGSYTFKIGENMFNLEIRKSSAKGIIDVFVVETNIDNAKIIIDNSTHNVFSIYQKHYESFNQIIRGNDRQILNIYDQNSMIFYFQFGSQCMGEFSFIPSQVQEKKVKLLDNILLCLESNGMKMKVSFYDANKIESNVESLENFYFCTKVNEILVSVIGDNEFKNKKLRNYVRNEILLLEMNNVYFEAKLDRNIGLLSKDILNTNFSLENLYLYNQISTNSKYIQVFNNLSSPSICLKNTIYHFKNDNVWKIGGFSLSLSNIRINIDPEFIEEIMDWIKNIIYRMKIKNYNVDKIFLINDGFKRSKSLNLNEYQNKIKEYIELYNKKGLVFHGDNFELPRLRLDFTISRNGLEHLLNNKFGFSSFFIWAAKGLTEKKHHVNLEPYTISLYIGDFKGIGKKIWQRYKNSIKSEFISIGIKGVIGNIKKVGKKVKKFFNQAGLGNILGVNQYNNNDDDEDLNENVYIEMLDDQIYNRKRLPRAFYGKFRYFKEFNADDAQYFDLIPKRLSNTGMKFIFTNLVKGKNNNLYVFTNSMLLMLSSNIEIFNTIYYYYIANTQWKYNEIYIQYNQNIDGRNFCRFKVENESMAQKICNILIEETAKNQDNFNDI